jgi:hypothetical protein
MWSLRTRGTDALGEAKPSPSDFEGLVEQAGDLGKSPVSAARRREMVETVDAKLRRSREVGALNQTF